jgi:hypothetical protein
MSLKYCSKLTVPSMKVGQPIPAVPTDIFYVSSEGISSIYRAQQSRCPFLHDDGDRLLSPKHRVFFDQG